MNQILEELIRIVAISWAILVNATLAESGWKATESIGCSGSNGMIVRD